MRYAIIVFVIILIVFGIKHFHRSAGLPNPSQLYHCSGKIYCSEMTSCEEAVYYQVNCPNTKMDGDNDGIPCEKEWCTPKNKEDKEI